jgi:uncharacterized protein (TIGR03437 family)
MLRFFLTFLCATALFTTLPQRAAAQSAVNVASYANPVLPNGSLAQGGMFTVFGTNLGPATLVQAGEFPLPTALAGTSITVTVGGTTLDCIMIFTSAGQVAAILPSDTPAGTGTMTVTYNGTATAPFEVTVVPHSFGMFGINSAGSGPGVFTNATTVAVNTISASAAGGEMWDIWGTGLGAVEFPDGDLPVAQDLGYDVQVVVGGKPAEVVYAGRSGCCSGVDQIRFVVPPGLSGCYVPVYLVVEGVPSNFTSISLGASGQACSDPGGITAGALADGELTVGVIGLSRNSVEFDLSGFPSVPQSLNQVSESAIASYSRYDVNAAIRQSLDGAIFTQGACTVYTFQGDQGLPSDPIEPVGLDAGAQTTIAGPAGTRTLARSELGLYFVNLFSSTPFASKGLTKALGLQTMRAALGEGAEQGSSEFFTGGAYTYTAPGGADVGAHSKQITIGNPVDWTNKDEITTITRSNGQTLTWAPFSGDAMISGAAFTQLLDTDDAFGAGFFCLADGAAGTFHIPAAVLQLLPASETIDAGGLTIETGTLSFGLSQREECEASGLDVCALSYTDFASKQLGYR